jgi:hypothetical protein
MTVHGTRARAMPAGRMPKRGTGARVTVLAGRRLGHGFGARVVLARRMTGHGTSARAVLAERTTEYSTGARVLLVDQRTRDGNGADQMTGNAVDNRAALAG